MPECRKVLGYEATANNCHSFLDVLTRLALSCAEGPRPALLVRLFRRRRCLDRGQRYRNRPRAHDFHHLQREGEAVRASVDTVDEHLFGNGPAATAQRLGQVGVRDVLGFA
jgi:hypothetical protein